MDEIINAYDFTIEDAIPIVEKIHQDIHKGLSGQKSVMAMIPSYTDIPFGDEKGVYMTIDLGGTNIRCTLVSIKNKEVEILSEESTTIDPTIPTGDELFSTLAKFVRSFLDHYSAPIPRSIDGTLPTGFSFSFPTHQTNLQSGTLLYWGKEFRASGVIGEDVVMLLQNALNAESLDWVRVIAMSNDTIGVLNCLRMGNDTACISLIVGTGTNASYREDIANMQNLSNVPELLDHMCINMELGEINLFPKTQEDEELCAQSKNQDVQTLSKQTSGKYLPILLTFGLSRALNEKLILPSLEPPHGQEWFSEPFSIDDIREMDFDSSKTKHIVNSTFKSHVALKTVPDLNETECSFIQRLCRAIMKRSSMLIATSLAAIIVHLERCTMHTSKISVSYDGKIITSYPNYSKNVLNSTKALVARLISPDPPDVELYHIPRSTSVGLCVITAAEKFCHSLIRFCVRNHFYHLSLSSCTIDLLLARICHLQEFCEITSASLAPDFSFLMYTTVTTRVSQQGISSPENFETILVDLRVPTKSIRYVIYSGKDYQQGYFFPDFTEDAIHFVIFVERTFLRYYIFERQATDEAIDSRTQSKNFKLPLLDSTIDEPVWFSAEKDRLYLIVGKESQSRFYLISHSYMIGSKPKPLMEHHLSHFYLPPPPYPHVHLLTSFSFLHGTRNPHLVLKLLRIRSESYVLVQQHILRPPSFPDQQLFASCLHSVHHHAPALLEMHSELRSGIQFEADIVNARIQTLSNVLHRNPNTNDVDDLTPQNSSSGSPQLSHSFNLSLPLPQLLQIASPFLPIETEIINSASKKYLDTFSLVDIFVLRDMRTVKHQAFVPFIQLSTDNESSQDSFIETINTVSSLLSNPDKPDSAETNPTTAKQMFDALLLSTGQELVPQHFSDEASSPNATFKPLHLPSDMSSMRLLPPLSPGSSDLENILIQHSLIFVPFKDMLVVTHPQFYTLLLDLAPQHHPAISLCLSSNKLFTRLPTSEHPFDPLTIYSTSKEKGDKRDSLSRTPLSFHNPGPLSSPMPPPQRHSSQSEQHTFFPYPQITLPHHPHSVQHKSSKALLSRTTLARSRIFTRSRLSHPFISSTFTPDSSPLATTHTPASTSLTLPLTTPISVSTSPLNPADNTLPNSSPSTLFVSSTLSSPNNPTSFKPKALTSYSFSTSKQQPSTRNRFRSLFTRKKEKEDKTDAFHFTSLHSVPDSVLRDLVPKKEKEETRRQTILFPSRTISDTTTADLLLSQTQSSLNSSSYSIGMASSLISSPSPHSHTRSLSPPSFVPHPLQSVFSTPTLKHAQALSAMLTPQRDKMASAMNLVFSDSPPNAATTQRPVREDDAEMNVYKPNIALSYSFDRVSQPDHFTRFVIDTQSGIVSQYFLSFEEVVNNLRPLTSSSTTALLHIILVHLDDANLARTLLRRFFLASSAPIAPAVFHEILLAAPFHALLQLNPPLSQNELNSVLFTTQMRILNISRVCSLIVSNSRETQRYGLRRETGSHSSPFNFAGRSDDDARFGERGRLLETMWRVLNAVTAKLVGEMVECGVPEEKEEELLRLQDVLMGRPAGIKNDDTTTHQTSSSSLTFDSFSSDVLLNEEHRLSWDQNEVNRQSRRTDRMKQSFIDLETDIRSTLLNQPASFSSPFLSTHLPFITKPKIPQKGIGINRTTMKDAPNALSEIATMIERAMRMGKKGRRRVNKARHHSLTFDVEDEEENEAELDAQARQAEEKEEVELAEYKKEIHKIIAARKARRMTATFGVTSKHESDLSEKTEGDNVSSFCTLPFLTSSILPEQKLKSLPPASLSHPTSAMSAIPSTRHRNSTSPNTQIVTLSPYPSPTLSFIGQHIAWREPEDDSDDERSSDASFEMMDAEQVREVRREREAALIDLESTPSVESAKKSEEQSDDATTPKQSVPLPPLPRLTNNQKDELNVFTQREQTPIIPPTQRAAGLPPQGPTPLSLNEDDSLSDSDGSSYETDSSSTPSSHHTSLSFHQSPFRRQTNRHRASSNRPSDTHSLHSFSSPSNRHSGALPPFPTPVLNSPVPLGVSPVQHFTYSSQSPTVRSYQQSPTLSHHPTHRTSVSLTQHHLSTSHSPPSHFSSNLHRYSAMASPPPISSPFPSSSLPPVLHSQPISQIPLMPSTHPQLAVYREEQTHSSTEWFYAFDLIATHTTDEAKRHADQMEVCTEGNELDALKTPKRAQKTLRTRRKCRSFNSYASFLAYFGARLFGVEEADGVEAVQAVLVERRRRKREKELMLRYLGALQEIHVVPSPDVEERMAGKMEEIDELYGSCSLQILRRSIIPLAMSSFIDSVHKTGMFTITHTSSFPPFKPHFTPSNLLKVYRMLTVTDKNHQYVPILSVVIPVSRVFATLENF
ncbi:Hexokinase [Blattamonas nauphoetae]|uniref:hexokinase n=1 Tax=Blattamonas nauphoetae TaxID=2049346 RepID=A0ABQ9XX48_9EUKA|nr:Hexokinase [Blattamonas nauphoetae]